MNSENKQLKPKKRNDRPEVIKSNLVDQLYSCTKERNATKFEIFCLNLLKIY